MILRTFGWAFGITAVGLVGALILGGPEAFALVAILAVLEISLSFDNAVVNAGIVVRMNPFWQRMFLTVGVLIAVFGMRLVFPLLIVGVTAQLNPVDAVRLALEGGSPETPGTYAALLTAAHPSIAAFGGTFLLVLFLDFVFEDREIRWLTWLERPLARIGQLDQVSVVIALLVLVGVAFGLSDDPATVLVSGVVGLVVYLAVNGLSSLFESASNDADDQAADDQEGEQVQPGIHGDADRIAAAVPKQSEAPMQGGSGGGQVKTVAGRAAFFLFLYLEVLDASFSFDGVIGAFAITQDIIVIAVGLGIGAFYIRSLTVFLVRQGTLNDYVYLEHGAHWAIGALAAILLIGIRFEVPELITGLVGVAFIGAAFASSLVRNRRIARAPAVV